MASASRPEWTESIIAHVEHEYAHAWQCWQASGSAEDQHLLEQASSH